VYLNLNSLCWGKPTYTKSGASEMLQVSFAFLLIS
jgi:hypothetical protein